LNLSRNVASYFVNFVSLRPPSLNGIERPVVGCGVGFGDVDDDCIGFEDAADDLPLFELVPFVITSPSFRHHCSHEEGVLWLGWELEWAHWIPVLSFQWFLTFLFPS
jgi:hypothetical protein